MVACHTTTPWQVAYDTEKAPTAGLAILVAYNVFARVVRPRLESAARQRRDDASESATEEPGSGQVKGGTATEGDPDKGEGFS